ncbi:hypothetical protein [Flavobacterium anhuiense]|uniref:hypothetical protein n=1 Tax=Flavobacterium anhuiense TaxID=459526 RepID=UPI002026E208|nr:hypothetical protein [Flavobacterium anhuiense]URM35227.1 hypothetical protein LLY39_12265 [Flavobacterium anhuiense]
MKKISGIGFDIPSNDDNFIKLDSSSSLSDTDIAIFSPSFSTTKYYNDEFYEGKKLYAKTSSVNIIENSKHWNNELLHFVENGGTLFIVLNKKEDFYVYTGTKSISGTGRNQKTTNHVQPFNNYNFLSFLKIDFFNASGKNVLPNSSLVQNFYEILKDYISYEIYLKNEKITNAIFTTKNKDRILGANVKLKKGYIVFLPNIDLDVEILSDYNSKTGKSIWNKEGLKIGKIFLNSIAEIDKAIRKNEEKTPKPTWLNETKYNLEASEITKKKIEKNILEIQKKEKENEKLYSLLNEQEILKDLLFETGKNLENAVTFALKILNYKAENYDDGQLELDQIIISPEGQRFIGECEGKDTKDIDISKFRQLHDSLNEDFEREEVEEKAYGLLFGNPQRLINPTERTLSFTQKCQTGAKREKIGLIKTEDLFKICKYISENKDYEFAKKCRETILNNLGEIIEFQIP